MNRIDTKKNAVLTVLSMIAAMVLSKGLGMVRSMCMAAAYGTGWQANAFSAASRIPLSFFDLLFSAAILGCFIPVYNSFADREDKTAAERDADTFACVFFNFILLLTGVLAILGMVFARPILLLITPGLDAQTMDLAVVLLRVLFPMILFTGAAYTLVGILQSKEQFFLPSMISAISNAGVILYFLFINDPLGDNGIFGLAAAYLIAWALQFVTLLVPLLRMHFPYRAVLDLKNPALKQALKMTPPIMIGSWLAPLGMLTGTHFAAQLSVPGAVTVFEYAININNILTGILTYGICNFTFPRLSRQNVTGDRGAFAATVRAGVLSALAIVLPVMAAVLVLSREGTALLYFRGAFTAEDTVRTAQALRCLAFGMPAFCLTEILSRVMYAKMSTRVPMTASLSGAATNVISTALLVRFCGVSLGVGAIAVGNTLGLWVCALVLFAALLKASPDVCSRAFFSSIAKLLLLTAVSFSVMTAVHLLFDRDTVTASVLPNLISCAVTFVPAAAVYLVGLKLLRIRFT
ncbi:MAG: murein biosynthesis integral membrane protein MurJ [Clostridia bacterium]|nr:murein biosynthesis integral membrane protein MurJ [Clostridia bacterium]